MVEPKIIQTAFAIRKLTETNKLSTHLVEETINCTKYSRKASKITPANSHFIDRHFDFYSPISHSLPLRYMVNQIIHSSILMFEADERGPITHFLTTSDRDLKRLIYKISLIDFVVLVRRASTDFPSTFAWFLDEAGLIHTWIGDGEPPSEFLKHMSENRAIAARKA